jgi:hypothetical protein
MGSIKTVKIDSSVIQFINPLRTNHLDLKKMVKELNNEQAISWFGFLNSVSQ